MSHKSLAIAYSMLRKAKKKHYDEGGEVADPTPSPYETAGKTISNAVDQDKVKEFAKAFGHARGGEVRKGINVPYHEEGKVESKIDKTLQGESTAGSHVRAANHYAEMHGEESNSSRRYDQVMDKAKGEHHKVLGEIKYSLHPKLKGLAKGGGVKGDHTRAYNHSYNFDQEHDLKGVNKSIPMYDREKNEMKYGTADSRGSVAKHKETLSELKSMPNPKLKGLARGGEVHPGSLLDESKILNDLKHEEKGPKIYMLRPTQFNKAHVAYNEEACDEDDKDLNQHEPVIMNSMKAGMVDRIMAEDSNDEHELDRYSEGGRVANECDEYAGEMPNEFDDLVLRDDLEFCYDGDNSGDHLGNEQEDEDRKDIVARILKSQHKKDKLPKVR